MALASRVVQCVCFGCFFLTTACLTITTSSPFDDGSFEKDSAANLTCTHSSYTGIQQWNFNTVKVLDCGFLSCVETSSNPERFSFDNDRSNGIFIFTISPVQLSDEGTIIKCFDGIDEEQFTVKVRESERTASTSRKARDISLGVGLGIGVTLLTLTVVVYSLQDYLEETEIKEMSRKLSQMDTRVTFLESKTYEVIRKMAELESSRHFDSQTCDDIKQKQSELDKVINSEKSRSELVSKHVERLQQENRRLSEDILDMRSRSMPDNLLLFNFEEQGSPTEPKNEDCINTVLIFCENTLGMESVQANVKIDRAHRVGTL